MMTITLNNGENRHLSDISLKTCIEKIKEDFRSMNFADAMVKHLSDIEYMHTKGYISEKKQIRIYKMTSEFAGKYNNK